MKHEIDLIRMENVFTHFHNMRLEYETRSKTVILYHFRKYL